MGERKSIVCKKGTRGTRQIISDEYRVAAWWAGREIPEPKGVPGDTPGTRKGHLLCPQGTLESRGNRGNRGKPGAGADQSRGWIWIEARCLGGVWDILTLLVEVGLSVVEAVGLMNTRPWRIAPFSTWRLMARSSPRVLLLGEG